MSTARIRVDDAFCELHGMCVGRAPEIFRFGDGDAVDHDTEVNGADAVEAARDAQFLCPVQAIEVTEVAG